ncbi:hypothetical protein Bca4012_081891 [Brassica carinata]
MSSGFVFTNPSSQVSGLRGKPLFSSVSVKRKCYINPIGVTHLRPKKRRSRGKRVIRVPAVRSKMEYIPTNEYSWRKCCQKPIKGSPHPRRVATMVQKMIMAGISSLPSKVIVGDNEKEKSPASETTSSGVINKKTSGPASTKLTKNPSTVRCKVCR